MASTVAPGTAAGRVLATGVRWSRGIAGGAVAAGVALAVLPAGIAAGVTPVLVAAGLLAGLPHGAIDHRLAAGLTGWPPAVAVPAYAAAAAGTWVLLAAAGPVVGAVALAAVLTLSLAHFALGEIGTLRAVTAWRPARGTALAVGVAGTGALLLPLARAGDELSGVAAAVSPLLSTLLAQDAVRFALGAVWATAAAVAITAALRAGHRSAALDVLLVGALGLLAPPLVAFAVWFGGWHALRHCARLVVTEPSSARLLDQGRPDRAVRGVARLALWPTLAAVGVLAALVVGVAGATDPAAAVGATLLVLLALTVPHMLVVVLMDRAGR